jgi:prolyl oligopeptidase
MRPNVNLVLLASLLAALVCATPVMGGAVATPSSEPHPPGSLPVARTVDVVDDLFDTKVADPYRWMEGGSNPELSGWLQGQGAYTQAFLAGVPGRDALLARIRELGLSYGVPSGVQVAGGRAFYMYLGAGEQLPKLMVREPEGKERVLVDPATRGHEGTHASVNSFAPSPDGSLLAYDLSEGGSEVSSIHVLDVATGLDRADVIERVWGEFTASWLSDATGFYYTQMAVPAEGVDPILNMVVRLHHLGRPIGDDPLILAGDHTPTLKLAPEEFPSLWVPTGSPWVFALAGGAHSEVRIAVARLSDLDVSGSAATRWDVVAEYADGVEDATLHGDRIYLLSHKDSSGRRVLSVPVASPDLRQARIEIPEDPAAPLMKIATARDALYVERMTSGRARILRLAWNEKRASTLSLPYEGWVSDLAADRLRDGLTFNMTGWTRPPTYYTYDPKSRKLRATLSSTYGGDPSTVATREVEAISADGTLVPLSILHKKGLALDGSHPTVLSGYGGYGIPQNPAFSPTLLAWLERGGVFAVAHVRGGGEKGEAWKVAGTGPNKMNGIRDFIACGEYLVEKGYTGPSHLAATGGSMGGVLVGRSITERPDLFAAAHIAVGIVNPLRILAAENGANQKTELGDPETEAGFRAIYDMDPYQHVKPGTAYPAVLFTVGLNDRRVAPWMTAKMAARLQAATTSGKPVLIRLDSDAGHGIGSTRDQIYSERADVWSFILATTGSTPPARGADKP